MALIQKYWFLQEVIVHGEKKYCGISGVKPPHLMKEDDRKKLLPLIALELMQDFREEELKKIVKPPGGFCDIKKEIRELLNDNIASRQSDDRASVVFLYA